MKPLKNDSEPFATALTSAVVSPCGVDCYEDWLRRFSEKAGTYEGFSGIDVFRGDGMDDPEHIVLVRFDTAGHLKAWMDSPACKTLINESKGPLVPKTGFSISYGLTPVSTASPEEVKPPAYYKLVVLGILAVYPLVLFTNFILAPVLKSVPYLLGVFLSVVVICLLMTYPVMPWLENLLRPWLHPERKASSKLNNS